MRSLNPALAAASVVKKTWQRASISVNSSGHCTSTYHDWPRRDRGLQTFGSRAAAPLLELRRAMANLISPCRCLLLLLSLGCLATISRAQDCDQRCATNNCNNDGVCICKLPSNSSILQGDRPFSGGQFCDTPQTMCDGTNTFWCESGLCNEIIQGENYTCICEEGYSGDHCELKGIQCGDIYCYHNGHCNEVDGSCDCPADWKGSVDCSSPTSKSSKNNTTIEPIKTDMEDNDSWYIPVLVVITVLVLSVGVVCGVKSIRKRSMAATEFHKLRQVQMRGFIDEDEDAFAHAPLSKAELV